jgi:hypothetical protein
MSYTASGERATKIDSAYRRLLIGIGPCIRMSCYRLLPSPVQEAVLRDRRDPACEP